MKSGTDSKILFDKRIVMISLLVGISPQLKERLKDQKYVMTTLIYNVLWEILALRKHPNLCKANIKVWWQITVTISSPFQDGAGFKKKWNIQRMHQMTSLTLWNMLTSIPFQTRASFCWWRAVSANQMI